jgi:NAD(P)-dependent dehydrogenase (short-subunit alcohol dehydrogenase family)
MGLLRTVINVSVVFIAIAVAGLQFGVYRRTYANGLGMLSEPSDVLRVLKLTPTSHVGRTALVTGTRAGGIGFETALALASTGARVLVHTRSLAASEAAIAALRERSPALPLSLSAVACDLNDLDDVSRMLDELSSVGAIDFLVLNAAVLFSEARTASKQNIEQMIAVNHVAHSLVALRLVPQLRQSTLAGGARVVLVSSDAHKYADVAFLKNATLESAEFGSFQAYSNSKLANVAFAAEFTRRFEIDAVSLHPGVIASNFRSKLAETSSAISHVVVHVLLPLIDFLLEKSLTQGATTSVYAALGTAPGGSYLDDSQITPLKGEPARAVADAATMEQFWRSTVALLGSRVAI